MRRAIDISGDGPNNAGASILAARAQVNSLGISVNGLPIVVPHSERNTFQTYSADALGAYFTHCVIVGDDSFVIAVKEREDLADAILRKLVHEIAGSLPEVHEALFTIGATVTATASFDCRAPGESPTR
jgi:hypothetical protein